MKQKKSRTIYQRKRKEAKLTQEKAAEALEMSTRNLQFIEAGEREPKLRVAFAMADLYRCDVNEFRPQAKQAGDDPPDGANS